MTVLKFEYDEVGTPIAEVGIKNKDKMIMISFFVDSGADITLIPKTAGEYLGLIDRLKNRLRFFINLAIFFIVLSCTIKKEDVEVADGVGRGMVPYIIKKATLIIQDHSFNAEIACALTDDIPYLPGRKSVFEEFKVCFDDKHKITTFLQ